MKRSLLFVLFALTLPSFGVAQNTAWQHLPATGPRIGAFVHPSGLNPDEVGLLLFCEQGGFLPMLSLGDIPALEGASRIWVETLHSDQLCAGMQGTLSGRMHSPPPSSSSAARAALDWARTQVGKPYVWGAAGPNGYDCSGLTQTAFSRAGVSLPRTTRDQYAATTRVPVDALQPGDLIFYSSNGAASGIYHVAIYAGGGMRVHAPEPGRNVEYVPMYWTNVLPYGGRV